jgi:hypothetical protein
MVIIVFFMIFNSCDENPEKYTLGEEYIDSQTHLSLMDTFSVNLSTVIINDMITSGTGNVLIGSYEDTIFGEIKSSSYFQIGVPESNDVQGDDIYDSLQLVIRYNKYYFGDTTQTQKILVYQLTENIETNENNAITSETTFNYGSDPIGSITYTPKPNNSEDSLTIKINDNIGLDLFTKLKENSDVISDNENFINYFKGLVLVADETYGGSIIGFKASAADLKFRLHTSRGTQDVDTLIYEFAMNTSSKQFNNITYDFSATRLNSLDEQRNELPSKNTDGLSFLQGGSGLAIRVDFPSLDEIFFFERGKIVEAKLSIAPLRNSYDDIKLPELLSLYKTDNINRINDQVVDVQGRLVSSELTIDDYYDEETAYLFDVTSYLIDEVADSYVDPEKGLLITLPSVNLTSRFYRFIADAKDQNTNLKIYYLSY